MQQCILLLIAPLAIMHALKRHMHRTIPHPRKQLRHNGLSHLRPRRNNIFQQVNFSIIIWGFMSIVWWTTKVPPKPIKTAMFYSIVSQSKAHPWEVSLTKADLHKLISTKENI